MNTTHSIISISPSTAPWLSDCLARFHKLGVLRAYPKDKAKKSYVLRFGDLMHEVLRDLFDPKKPGDLPHLDGLEKFLSLALLRSGFEGADKEFALEKARKLIHIYLQQQDMEDVFATVGVEVPGLHKITAKTGETLYQLSATLDRVLVFDGGERVVACDYKTGSNKLPPVTGILVNLCALKAAHPGAKSYEFRIEALSDSGVETTRYFGSDFKGQVKLLSSQVRRYWAAEGNYPATANEGCVFCPLRPTCDAAGKQISEDDLEF